MNILINIIKQRGALSMISLICFKVQDFKSAAVRCEKIKVRTGRNKSIFPKFKFGKMCQV